MKAQRLKSAWPLFGLILLLALVALACTSGGGREEVKGLEETAQAEEALVAALPPLETGPTQVSEVDGMTLVNVPGGEFPMGAYAAETRGGSDWEKPLHIVRVDAFWIDQTEVSNAMFAAFVEETGFVTRAEKDGWSNVWTAGMVREEMAGAAWNHPRGPETTLDGIENHPVMHVTYDDAAAYCAWAGRRLPTETEWEKAARGVDGRFYPWGEELDTSFANMDDETVMDETVVECTANGCDGFDFTAPVNSFPGGASPYGVLGMGGNLIEWTSSVYVEGYGGSERVEGETEELRYSLRGGSWLNTAWDMRTTRRSGQRPDFHSDKLGFRCAVSE